jgi:hypothetical protein
VQGVSGDRHSYCDLLTKLPSPTIDDDDLDWLLVWNQGESIPV